MNITAVELRKKFPYGTIYFGPKCPYCNLGGERVFYSILRHASYIYPDHPSITHNFWVCVNYPECNTYVGTHKEDPWKDFPLGSLANSELRTLRIQAHTLFDYMWKENDVKRKDMYNWFQEVMNLDKEHAHIGELNELQVREFINHLNNLYSKQNMR